MAPYHIMSKPIGPLCNLDCKYCFYLEKEALYDENQRWKMSDAVLERYVRDYIESQPGDQPVTFAWQGGEPTLCGVDFFRKAVALQKQYARGRTIENAFQTNGTLLNDEWCRFFKDENFLIGLSIDGPAKLHDAYRVGRDGGASHADVMRGLDCLKKHDVEFNTLTCVHRKNVEHPLDVYRFLRGIGSKHLQFIPIVERRPNALARQWGLSHAAPSDDEDSSPVYPWSVPSKGYGEFMFKIFERWVKKDVGRIYVQLFDVALGKWLKAPGGLCIFEETCGRALAIEHDGSLYSCDHYVYPTHKLGKLGEQSLAEMVDSPAQQQFGKNKRDTLPRQCRECTYRFACNGGCPKQRFLHTDDGKRSLNYLCAGYYHFFESADPYLREMAQLCHSGRAPSEIMT